MIEWYMFLRLLLKLFKILTNCLGKKVKYFIGQQLIVFLHIIGNIKFYFVYEFIL